MKKSIFRLAFAFGVAFLFFSCSSTYKLVTDENSPADQNVTVTFENANSGWFYLKEWNGTNIEESTYGKSKSVGSNDTTILTVPAGKNSFMFNAYFTFGGSNSSTTYTLKNIELQYPLVVGTKYQIKGRTKSLGFLKGSELFVGIYDVTKGTTLLKEWKVGETN